MTIQYVQGDATTPQGPGNQILVHLCNDIGRWGKGFVMAVSARWPEPEQSYRQWHRLRQGFELGQVQFVPVSPTLWVANLIGQHDVMSRSRVPPIRYDAVENGLARVAEFAREHQATVHMPRIGCGLAGGQWHDIEPIVARALSDLCVTVYDR